MNNNLMIYFNQKIKYHLKFSNKIKKIKKMYIKKHKLNKVK